MRLDDFQEIDSLPADRWARLADRDLYSTAAWARCIAPFAGEPHLLLDRDGGAAAVGYLYTHAHPPAPFRRPDRIIATRCAERVGRSTLDEPALADVLLPSLVLGGQRLHDSTVLLHGDDAAVLREFLTAATTRATEIGARSVMFPYVSRRDPLLGPALAATGHLAVPQGEAAHLDVTFADLGEYVASLRPSRRGRVRSEMRKLASAGVRTRFVTLTHEIAECLAPYEVETWRRHGVARELADSMRSLHGLADLGGDLGAGRVIAGLAELNAELLAFTTGIHYRDEVYVRNFGRLDQSVELPVYFGLVYYAHVEYALAHGVRRLYYGLKSEDAKRARGCALVPQHGYIAPVDQEFPSWLTNMLHDPTDGAAESAVAVPVGR